MIISQNRLNVISAKKENRKIKLAINGKFFEQTSARSGVFRVAYEMAVAIDNLLSKDNEIFEKVSCCIIVQNKMLCDANFKNINFKYSGVIVSLIDRRLWEQFALPALAKGSTLLNLCNLGPLVHPKAYTMIHDAQVSESPESYSFMFRLWYQFIQPRLAVANQAVLTVSEFSRQQLDKFGIVPSSRSHVIHNGCDHILRIDADPSVVARKGLKRREYVLALSNTQKHKNIGLLLRAFSSELLGDIQLALFGSATREDFEKLGYLIPSNVLFLGRVSDEELNGLLTEAVALAFPSLTEGFGLPPLEAMLLGCPVVAAPCGALVEICGNAALWASPNDPNDWVRQVLYLHSQPTEWSAVSSAGKIHAAKYTWEKSARQLIKFLINENEKDLVIKRPGSEAAKATSNKG